MQPSSIGIDVGLEDDLLVPDDANAFVAQIAMDLDSKMDADKTKTNMDQGGNNATNRAEQGRLVFCCTDRSNASLDSAKETFI